MCVREKVICLFILGIVPATSSMMKSNEFVQLHGNAKISDVEPSEVFMGATTVECAALCAKVECEGYNLRHVVNEKGMCEILTTASQLTDIQTEVNSFYNERMNHRFCPEQSVCYIFGFQATYYKARAMCIYLGARMADIQSSSENQDFTKLAASLGQTNFWIGLRRPNGGALNEFYWEHSGDPETYTSWGPAQPYLGTPGADCVFVDPSYEWHDEKCYEKLMYFCER